MFTCKQVSKSLNKKNFQDLPLWKRVLIKFHVKLCIFCGKYNTQVIDTHVMCRELIKKEDILNETECCGIALEEKRKADIKAKIKESMESAKL